MLTDIRFSGWITYLPRAMRPYVILMRLDRPVGIWLLLMPCWWGMFLSMGPERDATQHELFLLLMFALGACVMRAAGCIINDLWDRELDAQIERTRARPLASGTMRIWNALIILLVLLLIGLGILSALPTACFLFGLMTLPLIALYPLAKRVTFWPQAILGMTFNFGVIIGAAAIRPDFSLAIIILYVASIFWTLGYDTIYAHMDREDDRPAGIKSTALLFDGRSKIFVAVCYLIFFVLLNWAVVNVYGVSWALMLMLLPAAHLMWQILDWQIDDRLSSLRVFQSNAGCGLIIFIVVFLLNALP
jgi:4-hydroxybenzoate polyprenyltransferase